MSQSSLKSKTGCITCRIRKIKCDESKPACERCTSTGRTCDGYRSTFRFFVATSTSTPTPPISASTIDPNFAIVPFQASYQRQWTFISTNLSYSPGSDISQIEYLARHFTIKPVPAMGLTYGTGITYEPEARATLSATSEPAVHHALISLSTLRGVFEQYGNSSAVYKLPNVGPDVQHGLQQYDYAIRSLVNRLSHHNAIAIQASLLCCQLFMSIELAMDDFSAATQHFIRGIRIMQQVSVRPHVGANGRIMASQFAGMPFVDIFAIKLFLTPCPDGLTDDFLIVQDGRSSEDGMVFAMERAAVTLANMRLAEMGRNLLGLLDEVSRLTPSGQPAPLLRSRLAILRNLQDWRNEFTNIEQSNVCQMTARARLGTKFTIFFYVVLRTITTLTLLPPNIDNSGMETHFNEMLAVAQSLGEAKQDFHEANQKAPRSLTGQI